MRNTLFLLTCLLFRIASYALDTSTRIFDTSFHTLKVEVDGEFLSDPVIGLNDGRSLIISFDQLADDARYLRYSLTHCNADWQPSSLLESEYLSDFNDVPIDDYAFSSGTFRHYVNYSITIPSENQRPLVSGNYLLKVYDEDDPDATLLQARFSVSDDSAMVSGKVATSTDLGNNSGFQQLSIFVDLNGLKVNNPYSEIIVEVSPNSTPYLSRTITAPLRVDGSRLIYEHNRNLIFPAGNEFRRFETIRTDYPGMHIDSNVYESDGYTAILTTDKPRALSQYIYDSTQFGRYMIRQYNATDSNLGADYLSTIFTLSMAEMPDFDIYIDGELTNHLLSDDFKMVYDHTSSQYQLPMMLKQGSYNYRYIAVPRNEEPHTAPHIIEGNHSETRNEYDVKVYLRRPGSRADSLIAHTQIYANT